ncbi:MAG TPA: MMPL family transporter [Gammaproteobacteria bacterium]|nr:MMPL family transporter [Gammaproteobacteria bacterium]
MILRHRVVVIVLWSIALAAAIPHALDVGNRLVVAGEVRGGEAATVQSRLDTEFTGHNQRLLALVVSGAGDMEQTAALVGSIVAELETLDWIEEIQAPFSGEDQRLYDAASGYAIALVWLSDGISDSQALTRLRLLTSRYPGGERFSDSAVDLNWTGDVAIREDIVTTSSADLRRSEIRALPLSFSILCLAFGALVAAALPVFVGLAAMLLTLAVMSTLAQFMVISVMAQSVATLLGLALGIDYALLMISRFREELPRTSDARAAAAGALHQVRGTLGVSAAAVAIGFAGLALVPVDQLRSIGIAGMAVPLFAFLLCVTILPVLLSYLGDSVDKGRLWPRRATKPKRHWYRWARYVCDHPWRVIVLSGIPLAVLATFARNLDGTFPSDGWLPQQAESITALRQLREIDAAGAINRLLVLYEMPEGIDVMQPAGARALRQLHIYLNDDPRTESVRSAVSFGLANARLLGGLPDDIMNRYSSTNRRTALLELTPVSTIDTGSELTRFVRELRLADLTGITAIGGSLTIGGLPAATADYENAVGYWLPRVIAAVALLSFLALALAFRSVLIPLKAVALNLLAVLAAYGAVVLIFVDGVGIGLFGLANPIEGIFPPTPILVFCAAFGISMDYEVFLLSAIAKARAECTAERDAIIEGVARTGRLITSAAAIMVVVFGAFAFGDILPTQILGTALAIVVALDALLIRLALGPAIINLAGGWNWWPGDRNKVPVTPPS